ncbi:cysteine desulfurase NifS [Candidatus Uhrbacteria bacterium CG_4_9_14_3_um_filter_36_7]|uniref:Cysteine desulfurase NifS n=1 Tax=Candidatus Uhrbacteria bacterium CG_4_9_14_3_um_filter_36_7 TaxID=1975033 RepID=A0A2M7XHJ5_9BACT|nr:MAG: cysteine desulfurase NifS [Candidatus Uhrbacteria bacterium CG_4_9_14_3_um_filter_36_7]
MNHIYLDHAAATPLNPQVFEAMRYFFDGKEFYGNPSSFHTPGKEAKDVIEKSRKNIAEILNCRPDEIIFTSGGTESDNLAILGVARALKDKGNHLITSTIEHHAVLEPMIFLEKKEGYKLTRISVTEDGIIDPEEVLKAIEPDTIFVSIMMANNEIGTIQPIAEIGNLIQKYRLENHSEFPLFHTDACQASGFLDLDISKLHVDLLTFNGSKIYGPKGIGVLYIKRGIKLQPLLFGGGQEKGIRAGTEFVAGIVGLAKALELVQKEKVKENERLIILRDYFITEILKRIPKTRLNGDKTKRLPNNVHISFLDIEGEALLLYLDAEGIYVSTGSACTSTSLEPSHVILALGLPREVAHGSLRFSLGKGTTKEDIDTVLEVLPGVVKKLRSISPVRVEEKYWNRG